MTSGASNSIGDYTLLDRLADHGQMGPLYRARDERTGRTVALRIVRDEISGWRRDKLLASAALAKKVSHPHVASLYDIGEAEGKLYLVHEFVPGESLRTWLHGRPLEQHMVVGLGIHIADGLAEAERVGLAHRDIQPGTVMVTPRDQAKLIDLGFATWTSGGAARRRVSAELSVGQEWWEDQFPGAQNRPPSYMSPEEALGHRLDVRSDIFSLGIVLYQMATGQVPFAGATDAGTALKIVQATPTPPSRLNPAIAPELDAVISKMLVKSLDGRYQHAADVAAALRRVAADIEMRALEDGPPSRDTRDARRFGGQPSPASQPELREKRAFSAGWWKVAVFVLVVLVALAYFVLY